MSSQLQNLELANERLRSHELPQEAITWIHGVLEPKETAYEIVVGVSSSSHRDARPIITEELVQASDFETVVLTDERIMFFHDDEQHEIPLSDIRSLRVGDGMSLARISIYTNDFQRSMEQVNVEDAHRFAEAARDQLQLPVHIGSGIDVSESMAQRELEEIDGLMRASLISNAEWMELRRPILARFGAGDTPAVHTNTQKSGGENTIRNVALIVLVGFVVLITGALMTVLFNSGDEPATASQIQAPLEPEASTEAPGSTATQMQVPAPSDVEPTEEETAAETSESPEPAPSESAAEDVDEDEPVGEYTPESQQALEDAVGQYFTNERIDTVAGVEFSAEQITVSLEPYAGNTERSAIDVSADLAILIAEENDILDEPTHNARVSVPVEDGGVIAVNFSREAGQYTQVRE